MICNMRKSPAGVLAFAVCTIAAIAAYAQEQVKSRMFDLTYASAVEVADNFNRTWRGGVELYRSGTHGGSSRRELFAQLH